VARDVSLARLGDTIFTDIIVRAVLAMISDSHNMRLETKIAIDAFMNHS